MATKLEAHELIQALRDKAVELGRVPTATELGHRWAVTKAFGGHSELLKAAGMERETQPNQHTKITNAVFERDINQHLASYEPRHYKPPVYSVTWASISDLHFPFYCKRVVQKFYEYVSKHKPQFVILNGDAWDMYSQSKFPRSHNVFTPREERELCLKLNREFWAEIKKRSPKSQCYQLIGNHDARPLKRILEAVPTAEDWIQEALERDFTFEGVKTIFDPRQELMLDETTACFHGYRSGLGAHRDYTLMNTVNGHTHRGGAVFRQIRNTVLFECNSGFAGDPESKGLSYTPQKITEMTPGFSAGDEYGPRFIPA
jgi:predicted phosphodiesterase